MTFTIREESLTYFIRNSLTNAAEFERGDRRIELISPYHFMRDVLYLRAELDDFESGNDLVFEITSQDKIPLGKKMIHKYFYSIEKYDSISRKAVLTDFKVELIEPNKP